MNAPGYASSLGSGPERFLSEAVEHALSSGRRTPADFLRSFTPGAIMLALEPQPTIRSQLLTVLVGLRERTALRTPAEDAARMLEVAIEEGDCDAESVLRVFEPDARVRFLDARQLWAFVVEGEFWKVSRSKDALGHRLAQATVAYLLERALGHGLISCADLFDGISVDVLAEKLPRGELAKALTRALAVGREGQPFTDRDLYSAVPASVLVEYVALPQIVDGVLAPMARRLGFLDGSRPEGQPAELVPDEVIDLSDSVVQEVQGAEDPQSAEASTPAELA